MKETGGKLTRKRLNEIKSLMDEITEPVCVNEIIERAKKFSFKGDGSVRLVRNGPRIGDYLHVIDGMVDFSKIVKELTDELKAAREKIYRLENPRF